MIRMGFELFNRPARDVKRDFLWLLGVAALLVALAFLPGCTDLGGDRDGDGVPDLIDQCPDTPGPVENLGCPLAPLEPYDCNNPPALSGFVPVKSPVPNQYIVVRKASTARLVAGSSVVSKFTSKFNAQQVTILNARTLSMKVALDKVSALVKDPEVQYVQQDGLKKLVAVGSWGIDRIDQRDLPLDHNFTPNGDGAGIPIYVNDTGVTPHPDLPGRVSEDCFSTIVFQGCLDGHGHGTHVAGTAASNTYGIARKATIHSARFLDAQGSGTDSDAIRTLEWIAARLGPGVVNASWGGSPAPAVDDAVCKVIASGKVFVAAAGNEEADAYSSTPARVVQVITVGATDDSDKLAYFSNYGPGVDILAPGVNITSLAPPNGTATMSGTSMAAPHVAGAAALYLGLHPGASPADVAAGLISAGTPGKIGSLPSGTPNVLLFVGGTNPPDGSVPPKGEPVGADRLLRPTGTTVTLLNGDPIALNQAIPCCMPFSPEASAGGVASPRRAVPFRIKGVSAPTLWPLASPEWMEYTTRKGAANAFHFRLGPFIAEDVEPEWAEIGGPYLPGTLDWNPAFWEKVRELTWTAFPRHVEVVVIDSWACKFSQAGNRYMPWPEDAIQACGRSWHPEHERYARKVVEEVGTFGNVYWALGNEEWGITGRDPDWFRKLRDTIRDEESKSGKGFVHLIGTGLSDIANEVDYAITHARLPLQPLAGRWTVNNERNPSLGPEREQTEFYNARKQGLLWSLWRSGLDDVEFEELLAKFKAVVDGYQPPEDDTCLAGLCPQHALYINAKPGTGNFSDSTMRCRDRTYCEKATGIPGTSDCALGVEGTTQRIVCELAHSPKCHRWLYQAEDGSWQRCLSEPAWASCDHFDRWSEGTLYTGPCERNSDGSPIAGWEMIARGKTYFKACGRNYSENVCSQPIFVER